MSNKRNITIAAVAVLLITGAAFATAPVFADQDSTTDLNVTVTLTSTFPKVAGVVTVLNGTEPLAGVAVEITSTHDLLPLPPATMTVHSGSSGSAVFDFGLVSTAGAPGPHTLTVTVTFDGTTQVITVPYTSSA